MCVIVGEAVDNIDLRKRNLFVLKMSTKTLRERLKNKIQLTCKYKRNKHKLTNPLGEMPIGQKPRAGLNTEHYTYASQDTYVCY